MVTLSEEADSNEAELRRLAGRVDELDGPGECAVALIDRILQETLDAATIPEGSGVPSWFADETSARISGQIGGLGLAIKKLAALAERLGCEQLGVRVTQQLDAGVAALPGFAAADHELANPAELDNTRFGVFHVQREAMRMISEALDELD